MFNFGDRPGQASFPFWDMGLPTSSGYGFEMYDCWEHKTEGVFSERYTADIQPHDCKVVRAKLVKL